LKIKQIFKAVEVLEKRRWDRINSARRKVSAHLMTPILAQETTHKCVSLESGSNAFSEMDVKLPPKRSLNSLNTKAMRDKQTDASKKQDLKTECA
jgi:hypothetical protein